MEEDEVGGWLRGWIRLDVCAHVSTTSLGRRNGELCNE